jgi:hypothetical protein
MGQRQCRLRHIDDGFNPDGVKHCAGPYAARITYSDSGAVVFRFEVYPLREQSRELASDSRLLWIAVIAGPILP